jgi:hypothetical protein
MIAPIYAARGAPFRRLEKPLANVYNRATRAKAVNQKRIEAINED